MHDLQHTPQDVDLSTDSTGEGPMDGFVWPVTEGKKQQPARRSAENVAHFLAHHGARLQRNLFTGRMEIAGRDLDDVTLKRLWAEACAIGLRDDLRTFHVLIDVVADRDRYHPVCEYLSGLIWDEIDRVDTWLSTYLGVDDTPLHRAFGRAWLLGAVRRVLHPGCKFDLMLVLESPRQGEGKSTAASIMGGEWFSDSLQLGQGSKETIELTRGKWIIEAPELSGLSNREVEHVKAQISRRVDRARAAYGLIAEDVPRQFVLVGTTNDDKYLKDPTGNRRFMPVRVGRIDLTALARDRDQLWAEAYWRVVMHQEPAAIPEELWPAASEAQEARRVISPIEQRLTDLLEDTEGNIVTKEALWTVIGAEALSRRTQKAANEMTAAMRKLGWEPSRQRGRFGGSPQHVYVKTTRPGTAKVWLRAKDGILTLAEDEKPPACSEFSPISSESGF